MKQKGCMLRIISFYLFSSFISVQGAMIILDINPERFTSSIGSGYGGEFSVSFISESNLFQSQSPQVNAGGGAFQTFCVSNDDVLFGETYDYAISDLVITNFPGRESHPLSAQTAYLFSQFHNGNLSGYDYTAGAGRVESAFALQLTLWRFEDALFPDDPFPEQSQRWYEEANTAVAPGGSWYGKKNGNVCVLNLSQRETVYQSVLAYQTPEPSLLILFWIGILLLMLYKHKFVHIKRPLKFF